VVRIFQQAARSSEIDLVARVAAAPRNSMAPLLNASASGAIAVVAMNWAVSFANHSSCIGIGIMWATASPFHDNERRRLFRRC
jgi:hypothetical protein